MNFIFPAFLFLSIFTIGINILMFIKKNMKPMLSCAPLPETPKEKARYLVGLVDSGVIKKHILVNKGIKRDDKEYFKEYCSFLDNKTVETIKSLRGDLPSEKY